MTFLIELIELIRIDKKGYLNSRQMNRTYNSFLMIKLVYQGKNKIVKHQGKTFHQLRDIIATNFPEVPVDYSLSYLDQDKDQICLNSDQDLVNMLNHQIKLHKVYIKQSLSQTVVLDLQRSDYIQPSFEEPPKEEEKKEEIRDFGKKDQEEKDKIEIVPEISIESQEVEPEPAVKVELSEVEIQKESKSDIIEEIKEEKPQEIVVEVQVEKPNSEIKSEKEPLKQEFKSQVIEISQEIVREKDEISEVIQIEVPKENKRFQPEQLEMKPEQMVISKVKKEDQVGFPLKPEEPVYHSISKVSRAKIFDERFKAIIIDDEPEPKNEEIVEKKVEVREKVPELLVHGVICSSCEDEFGIMGVRYQCLLCDNFNLCSNCEDKLEHNHALVKVKKPGMAIRKDDLIEKYKKELALPPGHYVPSINEDEAKKICEAAKESYEQGLQRSKKLMDELYYRLSMSHKNPYEAVKVEPVKPVPKKVETLRQKTKYLSEVIGVENNDAWKFASQYPHHDSQQIVELYLKYKGYRG